MALENLLLPVQRQMIGVLGYDHLRQQAGASGALFNGLRWLGGGLHRAGASVFLADIFDYGQLRGNEFIALAGLFSDRAQILLTSSAMLLRIRQIVHDPLAFEVSR